jgi:hypothetical protein
MGTEWTQFGVRLVILLSVPVITLVLVNLRSQPVESSSVELTPAAPVQVASEAEESGVLPGLEEAFWAPYSSSSVATRFEDRSNSADKADHAQPLNAFNSSWRLP